MSTQYKARIESNLVTTAVGCFMGWGGFFRSVINEMETVTGLILYQTGAKNIGKNQDCYTFVWVVPLEAECAANPAQRRTTLQQRSVPVGTKPLPRERGFPELGGTACSGSASSSCLENSFTAVQIPVGWGQLMEKCPHAFLPSWHEGDALRAAAQFHLCFPPGERFFWSQLWLWDCVRNGISKQR